MSTFKPALSNPDLRLTIMTKMNGLSFARIRQANKEIAEYATAKANKFRVKAVGCFDPYRSEETAYDLFGFVLDVISFKESTPKPPDKSANYALIRSIKEKWTGQVLKHDPTGRVNHEMFIRFTPKTLVVSKALLQVARLQVDRLIQKRLLFLMRDIPKVVIQPEESLDRFGLDALIWAWGMSYSRQLRILQINRISPNLDIFLSHSGQPTTNRSSMFLALDIYQKIRRVESMEHETVWHGMQRFEVVKLTTSFDTDDRVTIVFWSDGDEGEIHYCCKFYFNFDGDLTQDMFNLHAIYSE